MKLLIALGEFMTRILGFGPAHCASISGILANIAIPFVVYVMMTAWT